MSSTHRNNMEELISYLTMNLVTITKVSSQNTLTNMVENMVKVDIKRKFTDMTPNTIKTMMLVMVLLMVVTMEEDSKVVMAESEVVVGIMAITCSIHQLIMDTIENKTWTVIL